jgi:hypothetical protein
MKSAVEAAWDELVRQSQAHHNPPHVEPDIGLIDGRVDMHKLVGAILTNMINSGPPPTEPERESGFIARQVESLLGRT